MQINEIILAEEDKRTKEFVRKRDTTILTAIMKNASEAVAALKNGHAIYKGFRKGFEKNFDYTSPVLISDPKKSIRKSKNTSNHYTLLFSNLPSWSKYPKRNRSLIATTNVNWASQYGEPYLILPFDGAKIGVCNHGDMWDTIYPEVGTGEIDKFVDILSNNDVSDISYDMLISDIFRKKDNLGKKTVYGWKFTSKFNKDLKQCKTKSDVIFLLSSYLSPKNGNFQLVPINRIPIFQRAAHEVWTDSKSYLIHVDSVFYGIISKNNS